ncbi:MAG: MBL fold metallo-hydrolase [bacterium]
MKDKNEALRGLKTDLLRKPIAKMDKFYRIKELVQSFFKSLPMSLTSKNSIKYFGAVESRDWFNSCTMIDASEKPLITWIGHSSFLIQLGGKNILLDPIFGDLMFLYKRNFPPGISLDNLPRIDYILISHNHGDHLHKKTLLKLKKYNPVILVPKGAMAWFDKNNFSNVYESDWWQSHNIDKNIKFDFLPAIHWSGQSFLILISQFGEVG